MFLLWRRMRRFLISDDGPTAIEYAILLSLIILVCLAAINAVGGRTNALFQEASNSLGAF